MLWRAVVAFLALPFAVGAPETSRFLRPYGVSRNPRYVGVALILIGWAVLCSSLILTVYAAIVLLAFHIRVIVGEEPWLARTFGADWQSNRSRVPRWLF
jgi:protein-S-isoprenylcysteine O-methyltransferase Ste14